MPSETTQPRRRFQFRLRTLMLFVTLACVIASWIGWRLYIAKLDDDVRIYWYDDPNAYERMWHDLHPRPTDRPLPPPVRRTWP